MAALFIRSGRRAISVMRQRTLTARRDLDLDLGLDPGRTVLKSVRPNHIKTNQRRLSTSLSRLSQEIRQDGIPGANLPFGIGCKYKVTLGFLLLFGSAFNIPFILTRFVLFEPNVELGQPYEEQPDMGVQETSTIVCFVERGREERGADKANVTETENQSGNGNDWVASPLRPCPPTLNPRMTSK